MRTIEYVLLTVLIGGFVIWGATAIAKSVTASFEQTAAALNRVS